MFLTILQAAAAVSPNSDIHSIHKSYVIYLEIYVVPIGHGFSFFGDGKIMENQC